MDVEIPSPRNLDQLRLHYYNYIQNDGTYPSVDLQNTGRLLLNGCSLSYNHEKLLANTELELLYRLD